MSSERPRILTIQDISCVGQCSLTVALPVISACGVEAAVLPSAVLSTHTGGFKGFTFRDLTDNMPDIEKHWDKEGIYFDAFYTGYLGSVKQVDIVRQILSSRGVAGAPKIIDPAMADHGKLYVGFTDEFVEAMKALAAEADFILPNVTEAAFLTGIEYREILDEAYVDLLAEGLLALGAKNVVLTGIGYTPDTTGVVVYEDGKKRYYKHIKLEQSCHGTGDIYAAAFTGAYMRGRIAYDSARIAADYVVRCIENTPPNHWYGACFEGVLGELIKAVEAK